MHMWARQDGDSDSEDSGDEASDDEDEDDEEEEEEEEEEDEEEEEEEEPEPEDDAASRAEQQGDMEGDERQLIEAALALEDGAGGFVWSLWACLRRSTKSLLRHGYTFTLLTRVISVALY